MEFRRSNAVARKGNPSASQGSIGGYVGPANPTRIIATDSAATVAFAVASTSRRKYTRAPPARRLLVTVLPESLDAQPTPCEKPVIERVGFNFSQQPLSSAADEDVVKLDDKKQFLDWMKVQRTLQNWMEEDSADMPKQAQDGREKAGAARKAEGRK